MYPRCVPGVLQVSLSCAPGDSQECPRYTSGVSQICLRYVPGVPLTTLKHALAVPQVRPTCAPGLFIPLSFLPLCVWGLGAGFSSGVSSFPVLMSPECFSWHFGFLGTVQVREGTDVELTLSKRQGHLRPSEPAAGLASPAALSVRSGQMLVLT